MSFLERQPGGSTQALPLPTSLLLPQRPLSPARTHMAIPHLSSKWPRMGQAVTRNTGYPSCVPVQIKPFGGLLEGLVKNSKEHQTWTSLDFSTPSHHLSAKIPGAPKTPRLNLPFSVSPKPGDWTLHIETPARFHSLQRPDCHPEVKGDTSEYVPCI